jgi:hypothetical protein
MEVLSILISAQYILFLLIASLTIIKRKILQVLRYFFIQTLIIQIHGTVYFKIILLRMEAQFMFGLNQFIRIHQIVFL